MEIDVSEYLMCIKLALHCVNLFLQGETQSYGIFYPVDLNKKRSILQSRYKNNRTFLPPSAWQNVASWETEEERDRAIERDRKRKRGKEKRDNIAYVWCEKVSAWKVTHSCASHDVHHHTRIKAYKRCGIT